MSATEEHSVHQLIVPAYVWHDEPQRNAALAAVGSAMRQSAARGENVDLDNATVHPQGLRAIVSRVNMGAGEPVSFVGYDTCEIEHADLVMIVVDAVVTS